MPEAAGEAVKGADRAGAAARAAQVGACETRPGICAKAARGAAPVAQGADAEPRRAASAAMMTLSREVP